MNYMFELVEFDRWMEGERPGTAAIVLWYALMRMCNRAGWKNPFPAAVSSLMEKTGLSRCSVYRAREELKALGRIVFTERGGRRCAEYYIVPFEEASGVVSPVVSHVASQIDIDSETILKQNKTKEERITPIPPQGDCAAPEDAASFFIKEQPAHPKAVPTQPAAKGGAPEANDAAADDETRRIPSPIIGGTPLAQSGGGGRRNPTNPLTVFDGAPLSQVRLRSKRAQGGSGAQHHESFQGEPYR